MTFFLISYFRLKSLLKFSISFSVFTFFPGWLSKGGVCFMLILQYMYFFQQNLPVYNLADQYVDVLFYLFSLPTQI